MDMYVVGSHHQKTPKKLDQLWIYLAKNNFQGSEDRTVMKFALFMKTMRAKRPCHDQKFGRDRGRRLQKKGRKREANEEDELTLLNFPSRSSPPLPFRVPPPPRRRTVTARMKFAPGRATPMGLTSRQM